MFKGLNRDLEDNEKAPGDGKEGQVLFYFWLF
jgi:hypothetical protein